MGSRNRRQLTPKEDLIRSLKIAGIAMGTILLVLILMRTGFVSAVAGLFVRNVTDGTKAEVEHQLNQPRVVVLKSGERIECRKVNDMGKYWGMIRADGRASAVKKEDVLTIEPADAK